MNVLSLFDGISCGQLALGRADIKIDNYYASEIDPYAISVTMRHYPSTIQLGDIRTVKITQWIDLVIGGSPCQGFSFAGQQLNFDDPRSALFFEYVRVFKEAQTINPKVKFILENVKMAEECEDVITRTFGVRPLRINSDIITAQSRQRLYWTNISVNSMPTPKRIYLEDILSDRYITDRSKSYCIDANYGKGSNPRSYAMGRRQIVFATEKDRGIFLAKGKTTKTAEVKFRILTPEECEELQTLPRGYTGNLSKQRRYHAIGNGWTVDIVTHILKHLK